MRNIQRSKEMKSIIKGNESEIEAIVKNTSDFQGGEHIIIVSKPSMGKTTLALQMALHMSFCENKPIASFSFEMSTEILLKRIFKISSLEIKDMPGSQFYIYDPVEMNFSELEQCIRNEYKKNKIKAVFIDYLGLISSDNSDSPRINEMSSIILKLRALAKELNICVISILYLKRDNEYSLDKLSAASINPNLPPINSFRDISDSDEVYESIDKVFLIQDSNSKQKVIKFYKYSGNCDWAYEEIQWTLPE